jgi:hypothetical protein
VARAIDNKRRDTLGADAFLLGQRVNVVFGRGIEIDYAGAVARADCDLLHVDVRCVEQRAALSHRHGGDRARHVFRAQGRTFQRIDCDVHFGTGALAHVFADEQHRGLVALALADHHRAVDRQLVELAPHGVDGGLIGRLFIAAPSQCRRRNRRPLRYPHEFQSQDAFQRLARRYGNRAHEPPFADAASALPRPRMDHATTLILYRLSMISSDLPTPAEALIHTTGTMPGLRAGGKPMSIPHHARGGVSQSRPSSSRSE